MRSKSGFAPYLALIAAVFQVALSQGAQRGQASREPLDPLSYGLLLVGPLMLVLHRKFPITTSVVTFLATYVYVWLGYPYGGIFISPIAMLFLLVLRSHRPTAWVMAGVTLVTFIVYPWVTSQPQRGLFHDLAVSSFILLCMVAAEMVRIARERRAQQQRAVEEETRRQASEERLTMAQELHDVLAHNISLIHVQASTALHLIDDNPEQARTALATIKTASKEVLGEMRSVLNVLREGAPRSPTAGLDRLDELIERSGLEVTLKRVGTRPLPPSVERAAYRIVQESLTNAARHAPGSAVTVRLEYGEREFALRVTDTGATTPAVLSESGSGNGIPGMRERAVALGGTLVAGPSGAGFEVEARLPLPEETS
ncbi:sensor histidine kinase [Nonomuraea turkmeniaca]|uniref:histidine kinase n=1 Tax=Nonomuraea turkmeniaca TaxID=103838 RepID=A0A5S4EWA1_9ACTN|nr:sensor histidine kinase [Nonomuraea turkmeniaca]TMR07860.1 sensor histidine kinase [Nonomuraea turkmeniaca]